MGRTRTGAGRYIRHVRLDPDATGRYPFTLPVVRHLAAIDHLELDTAVTFLVGDNGTGKSTLIEALAGGFQRRRWNPVLPIRHRPSESSLGDHLILRWGTRNPAPGSSCVRSRFYNVATEVDRPDKASTVPLLPSCGGRSLHECSHGESFLDLVTHRFGPDGLYVLDEPEAALSVKGCLALVARIAELVKQGCQS